MRKIYRGFLTIIIILGLFSANVFATGTEPPIISADGVVLMDADSGNVIYSKNLDNQYPPASTTKIMTALIALENTNLDDEVTIGKAPPFADGSKIYINEGEKLSMRDLLYSLLLQSANDSAEAIAEHISGSTEEFALLMNKRAEELGCKNTNFVNPHGLYDDNHRTTAYDLALILKELWTYPEFVEIATTSIHHIEPTNKQPEQRNLWNKNRLIQKTEKYYYEGCEGGKTGYTIQSKHSYVAVAKKEEVRLVAVLLHDEQRTYWDDVGKLFDWGFENYSKVNIKSKGDLIQTYNVNETTSIPVSAGSDFKYLLDNTTTEEPTFKIIEKDLSKTSFKKGDTILAADVLLGEKKIGEIPVVADEDYSYKKPVFPTINENEKSLFSSILTILKFLGLALLIIVIILRTRKVYRDKKRRKAKYQLMRRNAYFHKYYKK
ncbi:D-alanyl-D-alanine carboxypeptidase family protein [Clostridium sediminicola]|uniref:D-alanyl-D-alanine carboxypeptidase family protein n=1 Tax=Clostridium sediminicola TaxID=3114879 RepID=UPI0031F25B1B